MPCKCFLAFSGNFIIRFSGGEFLKDCSGHHSVKGREKVYLLRYGSKSYWPIRLHDFWECSISLTTCLFRMIQILSPFLLVCWNLSRHAQQFFKFECLESCIVNVKFWLTGKYSWTSRWALCNFMFSWTFLIFTLLIRRNSKNRLSFNW